MKRGVAAALAVVGLLAALAYLRGLPGEFVYDDHRLIVDNDGLKRPFEPSRAFTRDYYASDTDRTVLGYYRPVALLSNELDYRRGAGRALPFHITNIVLHVGATLLVFALARRLAAGSLLGPSIAAGLFALHPAHAESVAFISGRVDPLATAFVLTSVLCHLVANRSSSPWGWRAAAAAAWLGGLFSKEMAVTAPLIAAMLELGEEGWPPPGAWTRRAARYALYLPAAGLYLVLRATALGGLLGPPTGEGGLALMPPVVALGTYLRWLVLPPFGLNLEPVPEGTAWLAAALAAIVVGIALAVILWKRRCRLELATLGCVGIALLPVLQFRPIETALSERFLYLPSALAMTFAGELAARAGSRRARAVAVTLAVLLASAYAAILLPRAVLWRDELALWSAKEREDRGSLKARLNIARVENRRGNDDASRRAYESAIALAPGLASQIRAEMSSLLGEAPPEERKRDVRAAIEASPGDGSLWSNLGYLALERGDLDAAGEAFARAIVLTPLRAPAWLGSSLVKLRRMDYDGAHRDAVEAIRLDPTLGLARAVEGECLLRAGRACEALRAVQGLEFDDPVQRRALEAVRRAAAKACPQPSR